MAQVAKKKVIIFGVSGTIGSALVETMSKEHYEVYGTFNHRPPANLHSNTTTKLPIDKPSLLDNFLT